VCAWQSSQPLADHEQALRTEHDDLLAEVQFGEMVADSAVQTLPDQVQPSGHDQTSLNSEQLSWQMLE
jgi:hypothetical protein